VVNRRCRHQRAVVAAMVLYENAYALLHARWDRMDGPPHPIDRGRLIWDSSTVVLDSVHRGVPVPWLAMAARPRA
jgi:hypothetical protein